MSKYELTQGQCVRLLGRNPSFFVEGNASVDRTRPLAHPVEQISWDEVDRLARRIGLHLPSEAQWEYASRGGGETPWPVEKDLLFMMANVADEAYARMFSRSRAEEPWDDGWDAHAPGGSFLPNANGLHDMQGNVWEWCADRYGLYSSYANRPGDGLLMVPEAAGPYRVRRGGSFDRLGVHARSAFRGSSPPDTRSGDAGVRCAGRMPQ